MGKCLRSASVLVFLGSSLTAVPGGQAPADAGKTIFTERCAVCHGAIATGGTFTTSILPRIAALDAAALEERDPQRCAHLIVRSNDTFECDCGSADLGLLDLSGWTP